MLLARKGYDVTGIDFSKTATEMAIANANRSNQKNLKFYRRDALNPKLRKSFYHIVFSISMLHCFMGEDRVRYLSACAEVLKKSGIFAMTSIVDLPKGKELLQNLRIDIKTKIDIHRTRYFASEKEILSELKAVGLNVHLYGRLVNPEDGMGHDMLFAAARKD